MGGVLLPLLISFTDITLRITLQDELPADIVLVVSFFLLLVLYTLGYRSLWRWILKRHQTDTTKLLELGTLSIVFSDLLIYASLYQQGNTLSNLIWLVFYLVLIALFYLLGKRSIKQLAI